MFTSALEHEPVINTQANALLFGGVKTGNATIVALALR